MTGVGLAITTSGRGVSIALRTSDGHLHTGRRDQTDGRAASDLTAGVAELCARHGVRPDAIDEVRLDIGPGSYTGLRVAVTFARVVSSFGGSAVHTTTSLELLALQSVIEGTARPHDVIRPILDARRQRFHHATVRVASRTELIQSPRATDLDTLLAELQPNELLLAEPVLHPKFDTAARSRGATLAALPSIDATLLFDERITLQQPSLAELEPLYLMGSYAE